MGDGIQEAVSTSAERIIKFFCKAGKLPWSLGLGLVIENACNGRIETRPGRHSRCANVTWIWAKCPIAIAALIRNLSSGQKSLISRKYRHLKYGRGLCQPRPNCCSLASTSLTFLKYLWGVERLARLRNDPADDLHGHPRS
jgi:hypothetical protein